MFAQRLILDRNRFYISIYIRAGLKHKQGLPMACECLCEFKMKRPHLTCLWCRVRRVHYNKMKSKEPVDVLLLTIRTNQKHRKLKAAIRKVLLTLAGWTLN